MLYLQGEHGKDGSQDLYNHPAGIHEDSGVKGGNTVEKEKDDDDQPGPKKRSREHSNLTSLLPTSSVNTENKNDNVDGINSTDLNSKVNV